MKAVNAMGRKGVELQGGQFLGQELARLKRLLPFDAAQELTVCWNPSPNHELSGEVVGSRIVIYDESPEDAVNTLKHEYLDFLLTRKMIEPLTAIINSLIRLETNQIYREKERVVDYLLRLL